MSLFKRDLTFNFAERVISIEVWSSDFINFTIKNRVIRTTLDNTVQDIKEIISQRSNEEDGRLNPKCLRLNFKNRELNNYQPLSDFLVQEDHIRIQVEINKELMGSKVTRPALLNINLKLSNGRHISLRETLHSSILSLRHTIADTLELENGIEDIISLEFNGGVNISTGLEELTLGDLLQLDIAPLGDLNIYAKLRGDFDCRLSCPTENILRSYKMSITLTSSIRNVKDFILEQYTGSVNVLHRDIKVIYLGRLLLDETKIYELIPDAPNENVPFILHFVLNEPERKKTSDGFWSEIRRGNFFEFLPREPNPDYEAEVQRDERLRDQLRDGPVEDIQRPEPVLNEAEAYIEEELINDDESGYINGPPTLPNSATLLGETYQNAMVDNEEVYLREVDTSSTVYRITVNGREITLSSSQVLINDTDPLNPYLMLSPSGIARLRSLGVRVDIPKIIIDSNPPQHINIETPAPHPTNDPQQREHHDHQEHHHQQQAPNANGAIPPGVQEQAAFNININVNRLFGAFRLSLESLYNIVKYAIIYSIFIENISNVFYKWIAIAVLVIYALTRPLNRPLLRQILGLFPNNIQQRVLRFFQPPAGFGTEQIRLWFETTLRRVLNVTNTERIPHVIGNTVGVFFVDLLLFFTSFSPPLHDMFLRIMIEKEREEREAEAQLNDEYPIVEPEAVVQEDEQVDPVEINEEAPLLGGHRLGNEEEPEIDNVEVLDEGINATGAQLHEI